MRKIMSYVNSTDFQLFVHKSEIKYLYEKLYKKM